MPFIPRSGTLESCFTMLSAISGISSIRSRKAAFFVAEQLRFKELVGDRRTVEADEMKQTSLAEAMDGVGHQFLSRSCFSGDQHR